MTTPSSTAGKAQPAPARRTGSRQTVEFSVKGPVAVTLDELPVGAPGCSVLDLVFPQPSQVSELVFHNYYTAWLTVLVRLLLSASGLQGPQGCSTQQSVPVPTQDVAGTAGPSPGSIVQALQSAPTAVPGQDVHCASVPLQATSNPGDASGKARKESGWIVAVARRVLMPSPHLETGSHDFVSILATESGVPWTELVAMRLVLRQPSPSWHTFHVEEIHVFAEPPRRARRSGPSAAPPSRPQLDHRPDELHESMLLLLRHQTQAALKSSQTSAQTSAQTSIQAGRLPPKLPAYEINSLPPV